MSARGPASITSIRRALATEDINHIGNYRFVGATDNVRKQAELPAYFARLEKAGVSIENHLLVPEFANDPRTLEFDKPTYLRFRDERLMAIFAIANTVVNPEKTLASGTGSGSNTSAQATVTTVDRSPAPAANKPRGRSTAIKAS